MAAGEFLRHLTFWTRAEVVSSWILIFLSKTGKLGIIINFMINIQYPPPSLSLQTHVRLETQSVEIQKQMPWVFFPEPLSCWKLSFNCCRTGCLLTFPPNCFSVLFHGRFILKSIWIFSFVVFFYFDYGVSLYVVSMCHVFLHYLCGRTVINAYSPACHVIQRYTNSPSKKAITLSNQTGRLQRRSAMASFRAINYRHSRYLLSRVKDYLFMWSSCLKIRNNYFAH